MVTLSIILFIFTVVYCFILFFILAGFFRLPKPDNENLPFVSVVIAGRNEEKNVKELLSALYQQDYPKEKYQIIFVDDQSQDHTAEYVRDFSDKHGDVNITLIASQNRDAVVSPKKNAITAGIDRAEGEIILLTDADCFPPERWISGLVSYFTPDIGMVLGFSPYEHPDPKKIADYLIALEALSLAAVAAGTTGWGRPATCNGRNLAYRKKLFYEVGGFKDIEQFVSGDDDLFLKLVLEKTSWKIAYAFQGALAVPTRLLNSFRQFVLQRIRHASKGLHYTPKMVIALAVYYLFNLLFLVLVPLSCLDNKNLLPILCFGFKTISEFVLLFVYAKQMQRKKFLSVFPLAAMFHVPYIVVFGLLGQLKKIEWK